MSQTPAIHPTRSASRTVGQNQHIKISLLAALDAFHALEERGFTVLKVSIEHHMPVIWIQTCTQVASLQGAETIIRRGANGRESIYAAPFYGAQVQWRQSWAS